MTQICSVCSHPKAREIDIEIIRGESSNRRIASRFKLTDRAVRDHRKNHLCQRFEQASKALQERRDLDLKRELSGAFQRVNRLLEACEKLLQSKPGQYSLNSATDSALPSFC